MLFFLSILPFRERAINRLMYHHSFGNFVLLNVELHMLCNHVFQNYVLCTPLSINMFKHWINCEIITCNYLCMPADDQSLIIMIIMIMLITHECDDYTHYHVFDYWLLPIIFDIIYL